MLWIDGADGYGGVFFSNGNGNGNGQEIDIVEKSSSAATNQWEGWLHTKDGTQLHLYPGSSNAAYVASSLDGVQGSTWRHLISEWTPTYVRHYVDGKMYCNLTDTAKIPDQPMAVHLQAGKSGSNPPPDLTAKPKIKLDWLTVDLLNV